MFRNLNCGTIGVSANLQQAVEYAKLGGFQGIDVPMREVGELLRQHGPNPVKKLFADNDLQMGSIGFPMKWLGSEEEWNAGLEDLPQFCELAYELGATRSATWMPSWSDERDWDENCQFHIARLRPIAEIMNEYEIRLGLEFLGPQTLRQGHKFEFIHTVSQMLELCEYLGDNVGLLLDAWHWYTSGDDLKTLKGLTNQDVVYVHINDAPPGVPLDQQVDNVRALPGETGVIDLTGFLQALQAIGYDGPVTPEPFSKRVNELPDEEGVKLTGQLLQEVWQRAGV